MRKGEEDGMFVERREWVGKEAEAEPQAERRGTQQAF